MKKNGFGQIKVEDAIAHIDRVKSIWLDASFNAVVPAADSRWRRWEPVADGDDDVVDACDPHLYSSEEATGLLRFLQPGEFFVLAASA